MKNFSWPPRHASSPSPSRRQIIYYRTLADYRRLLALSSKCERFAVIGGGFIGAKIAAALAMNEEESHADFSPAIVWRTPLPARPGSLCLRHYKEKELSWLSGEKDRCFFSKQR